MESAEFDVTAELQAYLREAIRDVDVADLAEPFWRANDVLEWKLDPHQLETHALFLEWNAWRQTVDYEEHVAASGATLDDVWVEEIARRFGKTAKWILVLDQVARARPGSVLLYGTAYQKDIAEIIVPLAHLLLADAPEDLRPKYKQSKAGQNEGFYYPNGSVMRLAGLDEHPNAFRGRFSDGIVLSEAGFMKGLDELVRAVLLPQFQRRPWAFLVLESSTSAQLDHDFLRVMVPDAKLRRAYCTRTIDDNKVLTDREKAKFIRQAGGRGHHVCEREYFNKQVRDPESHVVPEFDAALHVVDVDPPDYYYAMVGADPGMTDLFGEAWAYWDFDDARCVVNGSWAARNANTRRVAAVNAAYEYMLYGRQVSAKFKDVPIRTEGNKVGWLELLRGEPFVGLSEKLHAMANDERRAPESWEISHPSKNSTFWDGEKFCQNPHMRVSDIEKRLMADLWSEFGFLFSPTAKDDKEAQINLVRNALSDGKLVFTRNAGPVIEHVKHAMWNEKRTDWVKHKVYGHYDCLSALIYLVRNMQPIRQRRPFPPKYSDPRAAGVATWYQPPKQREETKALVDAFGGMREWRR